MNETDNRSLLLSWFGTIAGGVITMANLNAILSVLVLLSTLIYTWQRIIRSSRDRRHRRNHNLGRIILGNPRRRPDPTDEDEEC